MLGTTVCRMHGGAAPQVKRAAQTRLLMAQDRLMAQLLTIAEDKSEPTPVRLAAIRDALDRAGLGARQALDLDVQVSGQLSVYDRVVLGSLMPLGGHDDLSEPLVLEARVLDDYSLAERAADDAILEREAKRAERKRRGAQPILDPSEQRKVDTARGPRVPADPIFRDVEPEAEVGSEAWQRRKERFLTERIDGKPRRRRGAKRANG